MIWLLFVIKALGLIMVIMGIACISSPNTMVNFMTFLRQGRRIYAVGICRLVFAVIFLLSASQCRWPWVIGVMGVLVLIGGVLIFALKLETIKSILDWSNDKSPTFIRIMGIIPVAIGLLIIFAV